MSDDRLIVIGITGPAGSGKDATAAILTALHGFHRVALADGVKAAFDDLSGPTRAMHKDLTERHNQRRAWQVLGTESRQATGANNLWVDTLLAKIHYAAFLHPKATLRFVVPDVSFSHETSRLGWMIGESFRGHYETWRIDRPGLAPIREANHSSEEGRRTIAADRTIVNGGSIDGILARRVRDALYYADDGVFA